MSWGLMISFGGEGQTDQTKLFPFIPLSYYMNRLTLNLQEEETDTLAAIKEAGHNDLTYWVRDAGSFECRYNPKVS